MAKAQPKTEAKTPAAATKTTKAEAPAKQRGPKGAELTAKIHLVATTNPKREGSKAADRWKLYKEGMTVDEALNAGITTSDLIYNTTHSFITIEGFTPELVEVKPKAEKKVKEPKAPKAPKGEAKAKTAAAETEVEDEDLD